MSSLDDMEEELEKDKPNGRVNKLINELANMLIAEEQIKDKGCLIGHYASSKRGILLGAVLCIIIEIVVFFLFLKDLFYFIFLFLILGLWVLVWGFFVKNQLGTFIDLYENAIVGKAESNQYKKKKAFSHGIFYFEEAIVEKGVLYLVLFDEKEIYRFKNFKNADIVSYLINERIAESHKQWKERNNS